MISSDVNSRWWARSAGLDPSHGCSDLSGVGGENIVAYSILLATDDDAVLFALVVESNT